MLCILIKLSNSIDLSGATSDLPWYKLEENVTLCLEDLSMSEL